MIDWNFDKYYTILWQLFTIAYKQALVIVLLHSISLLQPCAIWAGQRLVRVLLVEVIINTARPQTNLFATHLK